MSLFVSQAARGPLVAMEWEGGKLAIPDLASAARVAESLRADARGLPSPTAGDLYALGRLEDVLQRVVSQHLDERGGDLLIDTRSRVASAVGEAEYERLVELFVADFGLPASGESVLGELLIWSVLDENPAARQATERLFDGPFRSDPGRESMLAALESIDGGAKQGSGDSLGGGPLLAMLRAPLGAAPNSLTGQIEFVLDHWGGQLEAQREGLLRGLDLLAEETRSRFVGGPAPPPETPSFSHLDIGNARFSPDRDWMPEVVLVAKNVYVWLHQLSVETGTEITRLDQIPGTALERMAEQGFNALWLIGVWERGAASRRIKQLCGNPEAAASAYSVRAYRIGADLGGEEALSHLRHRCLRRGIRLAADMVPNHMAIDSDWVLDHPERFLSTEEPPFPNYRFNGPDLSPRPEIGIFLEDRYFDRTDAAVVFKRLDRRTGEARYIYHGNDGTSLPWNDTAQLDYLNPETREAVIRTVLEVARRVPILRFDAAMTLTRHHYQRLWFPEPGTGGAIPSRAEHGWSRAEFGQRMPDEFWRQVVDRVAAEAPETLLLAEAFWLMEGFFVHTLGMHRVYNSAFMHLVRDRDNAKHRRLIKDALEFDPRVLERYANFLTNPDEETAVGQFGRGDRYFGACALLATLPGLPLFGHGQIQGHAEKYGMEYGRSYHDEPDDSVFIERHLREIAPLLRDRGRFAGTEDFELYDFIDRHGVVHEDVFAYSNGSGSERSLVVFNNSADGIRGRIGPPAARATRPARRLAEALELGDEQDSFWVLEEHVTGASFLRPAPEAARAGLEIELEAFSYRVFYGFRVVREDERGRYGRLAISLAGAGVADLERALADLDLEPAADALEELLASPDFGLLADPDADLSATESAVATLAEARERVSSRLPAWAAPASGTAAAVEDRLTSVLAVCQVPPAGLAAWLASTPGARAAFAGMALLAELAGPEREDSGLLARLGAGERLGRALERIGVEDAEARRVIEVARVAWQDGWIEATEDPEADLDSWTREGPIRALLGWHRSDDAEWVVQEAFESFGNWRLAWALVACLSEAGAPSARRTAIRHWIRAIDDLQREMGLAGYRVGVPEETSKTSVEEPSAGRSEQANTDVE